MSDLHDYLEDIRRGLRRRWLARGSLAIAAAALTVTLLCAWAIVLFVPSAGVVIGLRIALLLALGIAIVRLLRQRHEEGDAAEYAERQAPQFGGRLRTWLDGDRRGDGSPLFTLLASETAELRSQQPSTALLPAWQWLAPAGGAVIVVCGGAILFSAGQAPLQLAAQRLWAGELAAHAHPRIVVKPGSVVVPRDSDVVLTALGSGFETAAMTLHASFDDAGSGWELAPMERLGDAEFGFVLVGVRDDVTYYAAAAGLASERHTIKIADLPRVGDIELQYRYPEWTGLTPTTHENADIHALSGTRIDVRASLEGAAAPESQTFLVVDGKSIAMSGADTSVEGAFTVAGEGEWHIAVDHEGDLVRVSDTFFISIAEDEPPEVVFSWPGHDRQATAIEEVEIEFEATDDYGIESLTFNFAVNGGEWQSRPLDPAKARTELDFEALEADEADEADEESAARELQPGDIVAFYVDAKDHAQVHTTALYFIDVRPFDAEYRESQSIERGGAGEGGDFDVAKRQKDIITATWNLTKAVPQDSIEREDQATMFASLQRTLRDQVNTLVGRSMARGLSDRGAVGKFIEHLALATEHMVPAADSLEALELDVALRHQQRALRELTTANAQMKSSNVSMSQSDGRGAGRSLGELVDLEMDPEKNRYEVPQSAGSNEERESNDLWRRLDELAQRQQQLRDRHSQNENTLATDWELQRLKRELDKLQTQLQSAQQSRPNAQSLDDALSELQSARDALESNEPPSAESQARASQSLQRATDQMRQQANADTQSRLDRVERRAENLLHAQERISDALRASRDATLEAMRAGTDRPMFDFSMYRHAATKQRMREDLGELRGELAEIAGEVDPSTAQLITRTLQEIDDDELEMLLAEAAEAFETGQHLFVIGAEALVEVSLERLADNVRSAARRFSANADNPPPTPMQQVAALRRDLAAARAGGGSAGAVRRIDRAADALARALPAESTYQIRGTSDANDEELYRLTQTKLDLLETALLDIDAPRVGAQKPRDRGRDSGLAARYFKELSRSDSTVVEE